jgi:hypothetical protein
VPHLAAERVVVVDVEEELVFGRAFAHRHQALRDVLAQRVIGDLLHQARWLARGARRGKAMTPPPDQASSAIDFNRVVGAAGRSAPLHHAPGIAVRTVFLVAGVGRLTAICDMDGVQQFVNLEGSLHS